MFIAPCFAEVVSSYLNISNGMEKDSLSLGAGNTFHFLQIHSRVIMQFRKVSPCADIWASALSMDLDG